MFKSMKEAKDSIENMKGADILNKSQRISKKKNIVFGVQKTLNGLKCRLDTAKDTTSELEGGYKEIIWNAALKIELTMGDTVKYIWTVRAYV